jgi:CRP/FNR family transcriptional regulator, cyclic AMP receptor protein
MRFGKDAKTELISRAPLFSHCSKGELQEIASIADEIDIPEGRELTTEGSRGREFFVIIEGTASVAKDGEQINDLGPGDFFGEVALVRDTPRTATVTATSPVRALVVTAQNFRRLIGRQPDIERTILKALVDRFP